MADTTQLSQPAQPTPPAKKSTKTSAGGLIAALGVLLLGIAALVDGDPNTHADFAGLLEAVGIVSAAFGAWFTGAKARDDDVTSEGTSAPKAFTPAK